MHDKNEGYYLFVNLERIFDYDPESACLVYKLYQDTIRVTR